MHEHKLTESAKYASLVFQLPGRKAYKSRNQLYFIKVCDYGEETNSKSYSRANQLSQLAAFKSHASSTGEVNLLYIKDILGHVSVTTTEVYAGIDSRKKREEIESAYTDVAPKEVPSCLKSGNLLEW